jgi:ComF family protein
MRAPLELIWNGLLDVVYPPRCVVCGARQEAGALCPACLREIEKRPLLPPFCDRCGVQVPAGRIVCVACEEGPEPPYAWSQAMGQYTGTLRDAIHRLKYGGKTSLAPPLGRLLAQSLRDTPSPLLPAPADDRAAFDAVVPVPLHPSSQRRRGFNQAERIARVLAQEWRWALDVRGLRRLRATRTQTALTPAQRAANVRGAFAAREPLCFQGKSVLIVDDVLTTSATLTECARVVREAGATRVCIVALARGG